MKIHLHTLNTERLLLSLTLRIRWIHTHMYTYVMNFFTGSRDLLTIMRRRVDMVYAP